MKKIYILEHFDFSEEQMIRLKSLGEVKYYSGGGAQNKKFPKL